MTDLFAPSGPTSARDTAARTGWPYEPSPALPADRRFVLTIPGEPVAKGRGRILKLGKHMGIQTPAKTRRYEDIVRQTAVREWGRRQPLTETPVVVKVRAYRGIAASWPQKKKQAAIAGSVRPIGRPDADNYLKSALDGVIGVVLADDSIVVEASVAKWYAAEPRLEIELTW